VPLLRTGKLVVACEAREIPTLEAIARRARENGAGSPRLLDAREARALEPRVRCVAALHVEQTGIVATDALVRSLAGEARARGATILLGADVERIEHGAGGFVVRAGELEARAPELVIAAGLASDRLAAELGIDVVAEGLAQRFAAGDWYALDARFDRAVSRLVYPVPVEHGLGIHLTLDVHGALRAGPDVTWIDRPSFEVPGGKQEAFAAAVARYLPEVGPGDLRPLARGVRAKLSGPSEPARDFAIRDGGSLGIAGLVVLAGIESPGLTASLAIAEHVRSVLSGHG
jgi:L-2-hydroxyglutarate oxidase LhgO